MSTYKCKFTFYPESVPGLTACVTTRACTYKEAVRKVIKWIAKGTVEAHEVEYDCMVDGVYKECTPIQ